MEILGKFICGKFVPVQEHKHRYEMIIEKCQEDDMYVSLNIDRPMKHSNKQLKYFYFLVNEAVEHTGESFENIVDLVEPLRLKNEQGLVSFELYTTRELSVSIENMNRNLNENLAMKLSKD